MKKYNKLYAVRTALWVFGFCVPLCVLLLAASLFTDVLAHDTLLALLPLFVGLAVWATLLLRIPFAKRLLREQTEALQVEFEDTGATPLYPSSPIFLSDNWFIFTGRLYLHKDFIRSVAIKKRRTSRGHDYFCKLRCQDKPRKLRLNSSLSARRIKSWFDCGK